MWRHLTDSLRTICIIDAKKMTLKPDLLKTSKVMERVFFNGSIFNKFSMESMDCFAGMSTLKHLYLGDIRLMDKRMDTLNTLPSLERFDFECSYADNGRDCLDCGKIS